MKYIPERVHRPSDMKVLNRKAIISLFNTKTPITVADIVEKTKISKPTANVLIKEMIAEGILNEANINTSISAVGKPPKYYEINKLYRYNVIIHIEDMIVTCSISDMSCNIIYSETVDITKQIVNSDWDLIIDKLSKYLPRFLNRKKIDVKNIGYIVIALCGIVDKNNGISKYPIESLRTNNYHIIEMLSGKLKMNIPIIIDNVGRFSSYSVLTERPDILSKSVCVIARNNTSGGVGGCMIEEGKLLYGSHGFLGEFGHIQVSSGNSIKCVCGNTGCLESMLSKQAIKDYWKTIKNDYSDFSQGGKEGDIIKVFSEANKGNDTAKCIVDRIAVLLARALKSILISYDPEEFILQGTLALGGEYLIDSIKKHMIIFPKVQDDPEVKFSYSAIDDTPMSTLIGAALYARNMCLFEDA